MSLRTASFKTLERLLSSSTLSRCTRTGPTFRDDIPVSIHIILLVSLQVSQNKIFHTLPEFHPLKST